jgi:hypothetical protein
MAHSNLSGSMAFFKTGLQKFLYSSFPIIETVIRIVSAEHCKLLRNQLFALPTVLNIRNKRFGVRTAALMKTKSSAMSRRNDC